MSTIPIFTVDTLKEDPVPRIQGLTGGAGADAVFEVIGQTGAQARALWSTGVAGKLVLVGAYYGLQPVDFTRPDFFKNVVDELF